nr:DAK2 domain-containing protein [Actinomycetales bacterium]
MIEYMDGPVARRWFLSALAALAAARASLDALNLFPVPDADTGSNVVRTLAAGARAAQELPDDAGLGELAAAVAEGSLWGARGNSGVILAQSLQSIAQTFEGFDKAGPDDMIRAFDAVASAATAAVAEPVEGTIITVAREIAAATVNLPAGTGLRSVLATALEAAYAATSATTDQLPALAGTGKVDAGAVCLVLLVEALARELGVPTTPHDEWFPDPAEAPTEESIPGYEVMYLLRADHREAAALRRHLSSVGEAVVVVRGAGDLWHVHVHLPHPQDALAEGSMSQVCVRRLDAPRRRIGVVAATTAPGLLEPLAEAGAVAVLGAGARTIARAVVDTGARDVVVLPCSDESAAAAAAASRDDGVVAEDVEVRVAGTHSNLAVYDAATVLTQRAEEYALEETVEHLHEVLATSWHVTCGTDAGELLAAAEALAAGFRADSPAAADTASGVGGAPTAAASTTPGAASTAAAPARTATAGGRIELLTVLAGGRPPATAAAQRLVALVRGRVPDVEAYVIEGGQAEAPLEAMAQ